MILTNEQVVDFFNRNQALNKTEIAKEAGVDPSTLRRATSGGKALLGKHLQQLYPTLKKYGYDNQQYARVISIVNHKGGVGKTTTTINCGKALSILNKRVLLVDMDPQGNLSQCFGVNNPDKQVVDSLLGKKEPLAVVNISKNLDLAPSDIALARADMELVQAVGGINSLSKPLNGVLQNYDYVLIDCPPSLNIFTNCALAASTSCLVTLQPEVSSIKGMNDLFGRITEIQENVNFNLSVEGILLTLVDNRLKVHQDCITYIRQELESFKIFKTQIRMNTTIKESQLAQQDIFEYDKNSPGAQDYLALAKEMIKVIDN